MEVDLGAGFRLTDRSLCPGYYGVVALVDDTGQAYRVEELSEEEVGMVTRVVLALGVEGKLTCEAVELFNAWANGNVVVFGVG